MTAATPARITISLQPWAALPAGRTLPQGVKWDPLSECYFINQADNVGRKVQANVFHRHDAKGEHRGYATFTDAGHVSTFGVQPMELGRSRIWFDHEVRGPGYFDYVQGRASTPFVTVASLPTGDISVDADTDLLCVKKGTLYRGYRLSAAAAGRTELLWSFRISEWFIRPQGHLVAGNRLYVHRDVKTKGASTVRSYALPGGARLQEWDTDPRGDEAEGLMVKDGWVWSASRVGGDTPNRVLVMDPLEPVGVVPVDPSKPGGAWKVLTELAAVDHQHGDKRDPVYKVREPGFTITTGVKFVTATDSQGRPHRYLLTRAGYRYALSAGPDGTGTPYLRKVRN